MTSAIEARVEKKDAAAAVLTEDLSLGDLFAVVTGSESEGDLKAGLDAKELSELRKKVPTSISWSSVQESVADSLGEAMHVSVLATLANGWKHYTMFMDDVRRSRSNPEVEIVSKIAVAEVEVLERKLKKLALPGHLRLKRGIAIPIS